jgi:hypothetical protein
VLLLGDGTGKGFLLLGVSWEKGSAMTDNLDNSIALRDVPESDEDAIKQLYILPEFSGSGRGITGFYRELKRAHRDRGLSLEQVRNILETLPSYSMQVASRVRFPRRHIKRISVGYELECDLADLPRTPSGFRYILIAIDCFSQMLYTRALPNKDAVTVTAAFKDIIDNNETLSQLCAVSSDFGGEFVNRHFKLMLKQKHISQYVLRSPSHASLAEHMVRVVKRRILTLIKAKFMNQWDTILSSVTNSINNSFNSVLSTSPIEANKWTNEPQVRKAIERNLRRRDRELNKKYSRIKEREFQVGQAVMPDYKRGGIIWKESDIQRAEIFTIRARNTDEHPYLYYLSNLQNKPVKGAFYAFEMQPALSLKDSEGQLFAVEKILDRKTDKDGTRLVKVKWANYGNKYALCTIIRYTVAILSFFISSRFNEWIKETDLGVDNTQLSGNS